MHQKSIMDYGDIYRLFIDAGFSIDITTAGWDIEDKIANEAGKKVSRIGTSYPNNFNISYHGYSIQAKNDFTRYLKSIINIVKIILNNKDNRVIVRCEDRYNQSVRLLDSLKNEGLLINQSIHEDDISLFLNKNKDIIGKGLTIIKKYKDILNKDEAGKIKIVGDTMGYSIDYNGDLYLRDNLKENYKKINNIFGYGKNITS
jgi:hypothetical protein